VHYNICLLVVAATILTACASERWPVPADGQWASDFPVVEKRYKAAAKNSLGTAQDLAEIENRVRQEPLHVREIRWLSPTEVMVDADWGRGLGYEEYYCVLEKKAGRWRMVERYLGAVS